MRHAQGAKLAVGHVPLYARGDDANTRQFGSLHAVQRHMADTGRFKMAWEDNEDEYDDFYRWPEDEEAPDAPDGDAWSHALTAGPCLPGSACASVHGLPCNL